jgi:hypothetical protein
MLRMMWVVVLCCLSGLVRGETPLPDDATYVRVSPEGRLTLDGQRVRYWATGGKFPGTGWAGKNVDPYSVNVETVSRLKQLGFNMVRLWEAPNPDVPHTKGDRSQNDLIDHFIFECARNDWWSGFGGAVGNVTARDVDVIDDPASAEAWKTALGENGRGLGKKSFINVWDERSRAVRIKRLTAVANQVNRWTGLRYADDPAIVVWELVNEDWWMFNMTRGQFLRLPPYFVQSLTRQFNAFLADRYKDEAGLRRAWSGNLLAGESVTDGSVKLLPLPRLELNDAQAKSLGVDVGEAGSAGIDMSHFSDRRGRDVIEFLTTIWIDAKTKERDALKPLGKSLTLSPMIFDTGIGSDLPTQFMHSHADASAHATYINGTMHPDATHRRHPWWSALEQPPMLAWDKPWLEQTKIDGKPFFVYENNIMQPGKYRAEHPMRMAMLGSINDWDIVAFHYWGMPRDPNDADRYAETMDYARSDHPTQGYHFQYDQVLQSAMLAAGEVFKNSALKPAASPTKFVYARSSVFEPGKVEYGEWINRFCPTAWRYGARLSFDDKASKDAILGPSRRVGVYEPNPYAPTSEMSLNTASGQLVMDSPSTAVFCGFFGAGTSLQFTHGTTLEDVRVENDSEIAYPVADEEKYVSIALTSTDGQPLAASKRIVLSAVSTSFNDGFKLDESKVTAEWYWPNGALLDAGKLPVRFARVSATIRHAGLSGTRYRVLDWHGKVIDEGAVEGDAFAIVPDSRWFVVEFVR